MKKNNDLPSSLADSVKKHISPKKAPPLHLWNPPFCGDIDIRILRDGQWLYMGTLIARPALVKLFSSVLRREDDGCYYLITPVEKVRIQVEDAPFVAISAEQKENHWLFTTNVGDQIALSESHPLIVQENAIIGEPAPYIHVRDKLFALVHRNTFYQLVEHSEQKQLNGEACLGVHSHGRFYSLGSVHQGE